MDVPFLDLKAQTRALKQEILALWEEILDTASFVGGKYVSSFEDEYAKACSVEYCIAVNSGTDALRFIFLGLGLEPGDAVRLGEKTYTIAAALIRMAGESEVTGFFAPRIYIPIQQSPN